MRKIAIILIALLLAACGVPPAQEPTAILPTFTPIQPAAATATPTLSPDQLVTLAQDASNRGDWPGAILLLDLALTQAPENTQALLLRGNAYRETGDNVQAISNYDAALAIDDQIAAVYHNRALAYVALGDSAAALTDFARAIELAPTFGLAYLNRAILQEAAGNTAAAALDYQIYITLVPNAPDRAEVEAKIAELQALTLAGASPEGVLFFDDFSNTGSGWYTNGDPTNIGGYAGDGYVLQVKQANAAVWAMPGKLFEDVRIDVLARKQGGDNNNTFGLMCRITNTGGSADFYMFIISSDGFYGIAKRVLEDSPDLIVIDPPNVSEEQKGKLLFSSAILQGEATNKITAICSGDRLALYVNDTKLVDVTDSEISRGQPGFFAGGEGTSIFFDEFAVYSEPAP